MFREAIVEGVTVDAFVTRSLRATGTSDLLESVNQWQLAQALNPPIKVTQAVLKAMEKVTEAKFSIVWDNSDTGEKRKHIYPCYYSERRKAWVHGGNIETHLHVGDYIQADCPLALQVLLGFTIEGVPV
jgi:hypothetical protein